MKNLILSAGAILVFASSGAAADDASKPRWDRLYAGISVGGASGTHGTRFLDDIGVLPANAGIFDDQSGFVVGAHAGFNRQFGRWALGLEGNLIATTIEGSGSRDSVSMPGWTVHTDVDVNWLATGVARVGLTWGNTLLFAKGGVAVMQFEMNGYTTNLGTTTNANRSSDFSLGWTAGAGVEWALTDKWSLRLDYDYINFKLNSREDGGTDVDVYAHLHIGRVGLNYALDWGW